MKISKTMAALLSTAAFALPGAALAQSVTDDSDSRVAEIIVTARKTSENMQTVPIAVTALDAEALKTAQVSSGVDLQRTAPSLVVATGAPANSGFTFVAIRGQGAMDANTAVDPAVATYIDGVYIARPSQGQVGLYDLESAQILRGPQGTLFGRNTTGGALVLTTVDPQDELSFSGKLGYGNYNAFTAGGIVNAPLGDQLSVRIGYDHREHDGFGRNIALNRDANDLKSDSIRGKLKWEAPSGGFSVVLAADYNKQNDSGQLVAFKEANPFGPLANIPAAAINPALTGTLASFLTATYGHNRTNFYETSGTGYSANANIPNKLQYNALKAYGGSITISAELGGLDLKSISAYRFSDSVGATDIDGTPFPILATESGYRSKAYSEEIQISGQISDSVKFIAGGYWSTETAAEFSLYQAFGLFKRSNFANGGPVSAGSSGFAGINDADVFNDTFGLFAQTYVQLSEKLRATAGLRWTFDKRKVKLHNLLVAGQSSTTLVEIDGDGNPANGNQGLLIPNCTVIPDSGNPADCTATSSAKFDYPAWTFGLDYQAADGLFIYAKTSRASHAGGFNLRQGALPAFSPDKLTDVEFGFKADMLDRRLRVNAAVFHSWQKDAPRAIAGVVNGTTTQFVANSGDIQIDGVEVEVRLVPWAGMDIGANLSLMDGSFDKGTFVDLSGDRSNEPLLQLPKVQFNIGATQEVRTSFGSVVGHIDYAYVGSQHFYTSPTGAPGAARANALGVNPGYGLLNGRLAAKLDNPNLELSVWGRNLTKKRYLGSTFAALYTSLGIAAEFTGEPRTFGVTLAFAFGGKR